MATEMSTDEGLVLKLYDDDAAVVLDGEDGLYALLPNRDDDKQMTRLEKFLNAVAYFAADEEFVNEMIDQAESEMAVED